MAAAERAARTAADGGGWRGMIESCSARLLWWDTGGQTKGMAILRWLCELFRDDECPLVSWLEDSTTPIRRRELWTFARDVLLWDRHDNAKISRLESINEGNFLPQPPTKIL